MSETPRAILFDLQGTCTDFFTTVGGAVREKLGRLDGPGADWGVFVTDWRKAYVRALGNDGRNQSAPFWQSARRVYRMALDDLLAERSGESMAEADRAVLVLAWETQAPWPDVVPGLSRLRERHILGTLSNADVPAVVGTVKAGFMPFDVLFSAQMFGAFKPDPRTYLGAAEWLALPPEQIMLVACHAYDVEAARGLGFQTAFITRPDELGPGAGAEPAPQSALVAKDFLDLAEQLGC